MKLGEIEKQIKQNGWERKKLGLYKQHDGSVALIKGFAVFARKQRLDDFLIREKGLKLDTIRQDSTELKVEKNNRGDCALNSCDFRMNINPVERVDKKNSGSNSTMGNPECNLTPPAISGFEELDLFREARPDDPSFCVGFDTEFQTLPDGCRKMISWQFAFVKGGFLHEIVFIRDGRKTLPLKLALSFLLDYIGEEPVLASSLLRYEYCVGWDEDYKPILVRTANRDEAVQHCLYVHDKKNGWTRQLISDMPDKYVKYSERSWSYFRRYPDYKAVKPVKVCLICHAGKVDVTGLDGTRGDYSLLKYITEVRGGYITLNNPFKVVSRSLASVRNTQVHIVSLSVRDTMCQAPAGKRSLEALGDVLGIKKIDLPQSQKENMLELLETDPKLYFEYASRDSVVTVLYCAGLYGLNNRPLPTLTGMSSRITVNIGMRYFGIETRADFDRIFRGVERVNHGKFKFADRPGYLEESSKEPINSDALIVQKFASEAYRGGYNSCSEVGYFPFDTYDYDLKGAYPTAMSLIPDIDWEKPISARVEHRELSLSDFMYRGTFDPTRPFVGYCQFEFPETVKYPCIPVYVDGIPVYPRTSKGIAGVYVAGPQVALALRLGAKVHCDNGFFLRSLIRDDMTESRFLAEVSKAFTQLRNEASEKFGKKSFEALASKETGNSSYGTIAQNVKDKSSWDAFCDEMRSIGCSAVTNPVVAMMTTSTVQALLLSAQNQIYEKGYGTFSVTTDGFISDCPFDIVDSLDLHGFKFWIAQGRAYVTNGDPTIWEVKHHQDDLVNFTTRGNVSLQPHGVCAHNSAKSGFESDSYEDRLWLMTQVLSRKGRIRCEHKEWISQKDIVRKGMDFRVTTEVRYLSMDFDMKRKPDKDSFTTDFPVVEGKTYEIAHFDTIPYETVEEFRLYRGKKANCKCLRTVEDWDVFFFKVAVGDSKTKVRDKEWSVLLSCIMGYRCGLWDIPTLNMLPSVDEKCEWINTFNDSKRVFKQSDWKNARRPERQANMLPKHLIQGKLKDMGATPL